MKTPKLLDPIKKFVDVGNKPLGSTSPKKWPTSFQ
jgi:hypothetical protein